MWPGAVACWARRNVRGTGRVGLDLAANPRSPARTLVAARSYVGPILYRSYGTVATSRERALLFPVLLPPRLGSYGKATKPLLWQ